MEEEDCERKKNNPTWNRAFVTLGVLSTVMALCQSILQVYALKISVKFVVIPYIWFFILDTWITLIYMGYSIRLLYLVRCMRSSELSRFWWYSAVVVMIVNPAQSVWWWFNQDHTLAYVTVPASAIYIMFFVLVCRSLGPERLKEKINRLKKLSRAESQNDDIELA